MRARPQARGTTALCLVPYTKKPSPIEPNSKLQRSEDSLNELPIDYGDERAGPGAYRETVWKILDT